MLEASSNMDPPTNEGDVKPTKQEEVKEEGPFFSCNLFDAEMVRKVVQAFLTGLASACVDNTTGGLFKSPASVAVDMRREMVDYLIQRSETFVAESVVLEGGTETVVSDNPYDNISDFIDDFGQSNRNFFSKVSGWILSERREDRVDDFVQEMEINGFWLMGRRESVAQTVIRNVDFKNTFHCNMNFKSEEELGAHITSCGFREINCENEGCNARYSAAQLEQHNSACPFKILHCEQKCPEMLMRREMDRHCITICPMKLVHCSFYSVGCQSTIPQCKEDEHRQEDLKSHLVYILKLIYKEASLEALERRAEQLEQASSDGRLAVARDARSLTTAIKNIDANLGPLEGEKKRELTAQKEEGTKKDDDGKDSLHKNEKSSNSPKTHHDSTATCAPNVELQLPTNSETLVEPTSKIEVKEDSTNLFPSKSGSTEPLVENVVSSASPKNQESSKLPQDLTAEGSTLLPMKHKNSSSPKTDTHETKESTSSPKKHYDSTASSHEMGAHESTPSPKKHHDSITSSPKMDTHECFTPSPKKHHDSTASSPKMGTHESTLSPKKLHDSSASTPKMDTHESQKKHLDSTASSPKMDTHESTLSPKKHHDTAASSTKIGTHESRMTPKKHHNSTTSSPKIGTYESTLSPMKHHDSAASSSKMGTHESTPSPKNRHDSTASSPKMGTHESTLSPKKCYESTASSPKMGTQKSTLSPKKHHDSTASSPKMDTHEYSTLSPKKHYDSTTSSPKMGTQESTLSPKKNHDSTTSSFKMSTHESMSSPKKHHDSTASSPKIGTQECTPSPKKNHDSIASSQKMGTNESTSSPNKHHVSTTSSLEMESAKSEESVPSANKH